MSSHCLGSGDPSCMVLPRYCRFRRASHLHSQPTPLSLFSREALYSVRDARSTTDRLANLSSCPPLLISTTCLSLLLSHHQQFICLDLFSLQTNIIRKHSPFGSASGSSLLNKTFLPVATAAPRSRRATRYPSARIRTTPSPCRSSPSSRFPTSRSGESKSFSPYWS